MAICNRSECGRHHCLLLLTDQAREACGAKHHHTRRHQEAEAAKQRLHFQTMLQRYEALGATLQGGGMREMQIKHNAACLLEQAGLVDRAECLLAQIVHQLDPLADRLGVPGEVGAGDEGGGGRERGGKRLADPQMPQVLLPALFNLARIRHYSCKDQV